MSDYNTGSDLDVEKLQDAYTVVNARVGFGAADKRWMVEFWGLNLTDEDYMQVGFDAPLQSVGTPLPDNPFNSYNAFLGAPRTYGMTLRVNCTESDATVGPSPASRVGRPCCHRSATAPRRYHCAHERRRHSDDMRLHALAEQVGEARRAVNRHDPGHRRKLHRRLDRQDADRHPRLVGLVRLRHGRLQLRGQAGAARRAPADAGSSTARSAAKP